MLEYIRDKNSVLDLGCGQGRVASGLLKSNFTNIDIVDTSPLEAIEPRLRPQLRKSLQKDVRDVN